MSPPRSPTGSTRQRWTGWSRRRATHRWGGPNRCIRCRSRPAAVRGGHAGLRRAGQPVHRAATRLRRRDPARRPRHAGPGPRRRSGKAAVRRLRTPAHGRLGGAARVRRARGVHPTGTRRHAPQIAAQPVPPTDVNPAGEPAPGAGAGHRPTIRKCRPLPVTEASAQAKSARTASPQAKPVRKASARTATARTATARGPQTHPYRPAAGHRACCGRRPPPVPPSIRTSWCTRRCTRARAASCSRRPVRVT